MMLLCNIATLLLLSVVATTAQTCGDLTAAIGVSNVVTPASSNYDDARSQFASFMGSFDLANSVIAPDAVVFPQTEQDLQNVLEFANTCGYKVAIRSGGHQYAGYSSCQMSETPCLQVDMKAFDTFSVNGNQVTAGVGVMLGNLNAMLQPYELTIVHGVCLAIGVGGHYQTSSMGMLTRQLGLGMDQVASFRIMTADGTVETVTKSSNPDLYDGVLGGAPGSFGIVLDFTFDAVPSADYPHTHALIWAWPWDNQLFQGVMQLFNLAMKDPAVSTRLTFYVAVANPGSLRAQGDIETHFIFLYATWADVAGGDPFMGPIFDQYMKPFEDLVPLPQLPFKFFDAPVPLHQAQSPFLVTFNELNFRYFEKAMVSASFPEADYYQLVADEIDAWIAIPTVYVTFDFGPWGGEGAGSQMNRNAGLNGYAHRDIKILSDGWVVFGDESLADQIEASMNAFEDKARSTSFYEDRRTWLSTDTLSVLDSTMKEDNSLYFPSQSLYRKLVALKGAVDPNNIFGSRLSIPLDMAPGMVEDPHVKNFKGEWFDYMGECDLKLMHVPQFDGGKDDLLVHVRTTIRYDYSFIESAALRLGNDTLEISSWGEYSINGVEDAAVQGSKSGAGGIATLGGYPIFHRQPIGEQSKNKHIFDVVLSPSENITISNMKDIVNVKVHNPSKKRFGNVVGLLGNFEGRMVGRDGISDMREDMNRMGQEWQVRGDEPMLFQTARAPQYPSQCRLPDISEKEARRLGEGINEEDAKAACSHLVHNARAFAACVYDVTVTNDLDHAHSGAY